VGQSGQVPDLGQVGQVARSCFNMKPGEISGPISAGRTGVVAKIVDKQEPTPTRSPRTSNQFRDQILDQRRGQAFNVFLSTILTITRSTTAFRSQGKSRCGPAT